MGRKIGALWLKESKDGKQYFSGVLEDISGNIPIVVFKNDQKEQAKHPDYRIVLSDQLPPKNDPTAPVVPEVSDLPF